MTYFELAIGNRQTSRGIGQVPVTGSSDEPWGIPLIAQASIRHPHSLQLFRNPLGVGAQFDCPCAGSASVDSGYSAQVRFVEVGLGMGRNKKIRVRIESLQRRITDHQIKIALERQRATPNVSLIRHWMVEIKAWEQTVEQLKRRLKKGKRHD